MQTLQETPFRRITDNLPRGPMNASPHESGDRDAGDRRLLHHGASQYPTILGAFDSCTPRLTCAMSRSVRVNAYPAARTEEDKPHVGLVVVPI